MGKHTKSEPITSRNAKTGEMHDLRYWWSQWQTAKASGVVLHEEQALSQIDRLLDAKLAAR